MKLSPVSVKKYSCLLCVFMALPAFIIAQKLPNIQKNSLRAPSTIKIDGKTNEWNDQFMAFNNRIIAFYTIANDDDHVYLVVHSINRTITNKIMLGGIIFTVNTSQKKEKGGVSITYPVIGKAEVDMILKNSSEGFEQTIDEKQKSAVLKHNDSVLTTGNKKNLDKLKFIQVTGIKELPDSILSIYNTSGIKVAGLLGSNHVYNYELAIPLKYLGLSTQRQATFHYNIKFPGSSKNEIIPPIILLGANPKPPLDDDGVDLRTLDAGTDFWGQYTLTAK